MATKTSQASGNWATGSTWVGGAIPADGDDVVISAGHSVLMNADLSAWTGLFSVTIQGSSGTPGMLYFKDGTNGYLKIRAGYTISGTAGANKGRLLANSDGVWGNSDPLTLANTAVIDLQTTAYIDAANLDIFLQADWPSLLYVRTYGTKKTVTCDSATDTFTCAAHGYTANTPLAFMGFDLPSPIIENQVYFVANPTTDTFQLKYSTISESLLVQLTSDGSGTIEALTGHTNTSTAVMNVLDDISTDPAWSTTSNKNFVCLSDCHDSSTMDYQRVTLAGKTATTITLSSNVDSVQYPLAAVVLVYRNVAIRSNSTATTHWMMKNAVGAYTNCEHRNTVSSGTNYYSFVHDTGTDCVVSGCVSALNGIFHYGSGCTFHDYGTCTSTAAPFQDTNDALNTGTILTVNYVFSGCSGARHGIIGYICGAARAFNYCNEVLNEGALYAVAIAHHTCKGVKDIAPFCGVVGIIAQQCQDLRHQVPMSGGNYLCQNVGYDQVFSGSYQGYVYYGNADFGPHVILRNAITDPRTIIGVFSLNASLRNYTRICFENENRVAGANRFLGAFGGVVETACNGTDGAPSVDPLAGNGKCLKVTTQSLCSPYAPVLVFERHRLWCTAGARTVTYRIQSQYALALDDLTLEYCWRDAADTEWALDVSQAINARASDADWTQSIQASFTQAVDGWVILKLSLKKYSAGNAVFVWPTPVVT